MRPDQEYEKLAPRFQLPVKITIREKNMGRGNMPGFFRDLARAHVVVPFDARVPCATKPTPQERSHVIHSSVRKPRGLFRTNGI